MILASLDADMTGLDPDNDMVLEVALVVEDTSMHSLKDVQDLPHWVGRIAYDRIVGHPAALAMNVKLIAAMPEVLEQFGQGHRPEGWYRYLDEAMRDAIDFLDEQYGHVTGSLTKPPKFVIAGKNVGGFDMLFMPDFFKRRCIHRTIDAGSVALGGENHWWSRHRPPSLGDLTERDVAHTALQDARDVIEVLRRCTGMYGRVGRD